MTYTVYMWHLGELGHIAKNQTVEQVMDMDYVYVKFNNKRGVAWVTNCCDFRCH